MVFPPEIEVSLFYLGKFLWVLEPIVTTINNLQDVFTAVGSSTAQIDLPQFHELGSQSSGMSSVLEVLQLALRPVIAAAPIANGNADCPRHGGQDGTQRRHFATTDQLAHLFPQRPHAHACRLTWTNKGSRWQLAQKTSRNRFVTYISKYMSKPACIILAVTPANTNPANSDGLKMAQEVDPEGNRTIGVLTKDAGTDVVDILAGRVIPLRLGYVPVVNRGQHDTDTFKPIQQVLDAEHHFFESHPAYQGKAQYCELQSLSRPLGGGNSSSMLLCIITEFTNEFRTVIDDNTNDPSLNELSGGARISFVFYELFNVGIKSIDPFDQVKDGDIRIILYNSSVCVECGSTSALFVGTAAFEVIVKQIKRLEEPGLKWYQLVYDELIRILGQLLSNIIQGFRRYPALHERFNSVVVNFIKTTMTPTTKLVSDMVAMQACYVNTTHPYFFNVHKVRLLLSLFAVIHPFSRLWHSDRLDANKPAMPEPKQGKVTAAQMNNKDLGVDMTSSKSQQQKAKKGPHAMEAAQLLFHSHFNIVKREMIDMVQKAISPTLVNHSKENIQHEMLQELYKPDVLEDLFKESELVVARRKEVVSMVQALNKAEEIVAGV
ncbi:Dynamin central region domain containing protein [Lactarius tabidus]